jgi:cytochrome c oxidase assembly protein subunit 15
MDVTVLTRKRVLVNWLLTGCFLIATMVVIGGITRLTHSGLSMVEWNLVVGSLPPMNESDWQVVFDKYKQFPEYQLVNTHFTLEEFKSIFWWEYIHRFLGRFIGVVFMLPFIYFLWRKMLSRPLIARLVIILALGGLQGFLGWYMVKSGLIANPDVSHYRLALHLITAFITFAYTLWVAMELRYNDSNVRNLVPGLRNALWLFLFVLLLQIVYGAFVAGLNAGFVYNTYPKMGDDWIAPAVTALSPWLRNFTENLAGVQFVHRCLPLVLVGVMAYAWVLAKKQNLNALQKKALTWLTAMLGVQFGLGIITLLTAVPVIMGVLHQIAALLLLAAAVYSLFVVTDPSKRELFPAKTLD